MGATTIGLVGSGRWGQLILQDLIGLGAAVHVADPDPQARLRAEELGAAGAQHDMSRWPSVDGVVVATPATTHSDVVKAVSRLGAPVYCEKPLTTHPDDARTLVGDMGDRLHVLHTWRYHPGVEMLGTLARSGGLGDIHGLRTYRTNWTSPRTDTDAMWTLLPHDLSIAVEILGSIPPPSDATVEVIDGRVASAFARFGTAGSPWLLVDASTRYADKRREVRVHGSEGVAVLDGNDDHQVTIARGHQLEPEIETIALDPTPPLRRELAAVIDHLNGGPTPKSSAAEGLAVVEAIATLRALAGLVP